MLNGGALTSINTLPHVSKFSKFYFLNLHKKSTHQIHKSQYSFLFFKFMLIEHMLIQIHK